MDGAFAALDQAARSYYGTGDEPARADEKYESHDGAVVVSPLSVRGISAEVFEGLRVDTMVRCAEGAEVSEVLALKGPAGKEGLELLQAVEGLAGHIKPGSDGVYAVQAGAAASKALEVCKGLALRVRQGMGSGQQSVRA